MDREFVTGFSGKGYREYGWRLLDSFQKYSGGQSLIAYTHDIDEQVRPWVRQREQDDIPGLAEFLAEHKNNKAVQGRADPGDRWKAKEKANGYSFRFDAYKFCRMVFTMHHAAHHCETEYMVWLDGDTVVRKEIPADLVQRALPEGFDYSYLGRAKKYTEAGFLVFKVPEVLPILDMWVGYYTSGDFIYEDEWHSAWLFDRAREWFPTINGYNLTPRGSGHVIHQCWVGSIFDHCKGNRKKKGRSPEAR